MQQFFKYSIVGMALLFLILILYVYLKQRKEIQRKRVPAVSQTFDFDIP
jgi:hypothetical protein